MYREAMGLVLLTRAVPRMLLSFVSGDAGLGLGVFGRGGGMYLTQVSMMEVMQRLLANLVEVKQLYICRMLNEVHIWVRDKGGRAYDIKMMRKTMNPPGMPSSRVCSVSYPKPLRIRPENCVSSD